MCNKGRFGTLEIVYLNLWQCTRMHPDMFSFVTLLRPVKMVLQKVPRQNVSLQNVPIQNVPAPITPQDSKLPNLKTSQASKRPKSQNVPSLKTSQP